MLYAKSMRHYANSTPAYRSFFLHISESMNILTYVYNMHVLNYYPENLTVIGCTFQPSTSTNMEATSAPSSALMPNVIDLVSPGTKLK